MRVNCILFYLSILSIYIIVACIFDEIKIPYSVFDEIRTEKLNELLSSIAGSFLMGAFVYYLTVIVNNKKERRNRKWEIYGLFEELAGQNVILDEEIGSDFHKTASIEWFKQEWTNEMNENYIKKISSTIGKMNLYRHLLSEEELNQLYLIGTNLCIKCPSEFSDQKEVEINFERLKQIYISIEKLYNSIKRYVGRNKFK